MLRTGLSSASPRLHYTQRPCPTRNVDLVHASLQRFAGPSNSPLPGLMHLQCKLSLTPKQKKQPVTEVLYATASVVLPPCFSFARVRGRRVIPNPVQVHSHLLWGQEQKSTPPRQTSLQLRSSLYLALCLCLFIMPESMAKGFAQRWFGWHEVMMI